MSLCLIAFEVLKEVYWVAYDSFTAGAFASAQILTLSYEEYIKYGMSLLKDLAWYFKEAGLEAKRKMIGSIFPTKLIFQDGKYRTDGLNPVLAIILQKTNNLQKEKTGNIVISENVSGDVPFTDLTSNQFIEGMRKIFELEPFIKIYSINANREEEKFTPESAVASL